MKMIKRTFMFFTILSSLGCFMQRKGTDSVNISPDTLFAKKIKYACGKEGYVLTICESKKNCPINNNCDFSYNNLFIADTGKKIALIEQLLSFEGDTASVCCQIYCYKKNAIKYLDSIQSNSYSIQVAALYHINMICFSSFSTSFAPFPVLYDMERHLEVNNDLNEIATVFKIYKKWFYKNKADNFSNYSFPLLGTKFTWRFGMQTYKSFNELPVHESEFRYSIGRKAT